MKKLLLALVLLGTVGFSTVTRYGSVGNGWIIDEIVSEVIVTSGTLVREFEVGDLSKISVALGSQSTGNITTATLTWLAQGGATLTSNTLVIGTEHTPLYGKKVIVTITNGIAAPNTITGVISVKY